MLFEKTYGIDLGSSFGYTKCFDQRVEIADIWLIGHFKGEGKYYDWNDVRKEEDDSEEISERHFLGEEIGEKPAKRKGNKDCD